MTSSLSIDKSSFVTIVEVLQEVFDEKKPSIDLRSDARDVLLWINDARKAPLNQNEVHLSLPHLNQLVQLFNKVNLGESVQREAGNVLRMLANNLDAAKVGWDVAVKGWDTLKKSVQSIEIDRMELSALTLSLQNVAQGKSSPDEQTLRTLGMNVLNEYVTQGNDVGRENVIQLSPRQAEQLLSVLKQPQEMLNTPEMQQAAQEMFEELLIEGVMQRIEHVEPGLVKKLINYLLERLEKLFDIQLLKPRDLPQEPDWKEKAVEYGKKLLAGSNDLSKDIDNRLQATNLNVDKYSEARRFLERAIVEPAVFANIVTAQVERELNRTDVNEQERTENALAFLQAGREIQSELERVQQEKVQDLEQELSEGLKTVTISEKELAGEVKGLVDIPVVVQGENGPVGVEKVYEVIQHTLGHNVLPINFDPKELAAAAEGVKIGQALQYKDPDGIVRSIPLVEVEGLSKEERNQLLDGMVRGDEQSLDQYQHIIREISLSKTTELSR